MSSVSPIEKIAEEKTGVSGIDGVVLLVNNLLSTGKTIGEVEKELHLGQSFVHYYCKRNGIKIKITTQRSLEKSV